MEALRAFTDALLGLSVDKAEGLNTLQVCVRAVVVYIVLIAYVRFAKKRFLSEATTFDAKRFVSALLEAEIAGLIAAGKGDTREIAEIAVREATKKHRRSQGVASRTALRREELRRVASASMNPGRTP